MRYMIPIFYRISHQVSAFTFSCHHRHCLSLRTVLSVPKLCEVFKTKVSAGPQELDIMDWMSRVALELIGQGGLGYSFDALEGVKNEYAEAAREYTYVPPYTTHRNILRALTTCQYDLNMGRPTNARMLFWRQFAPWIAELGPSPVRQWLARTLPWKDLNRLVEISEAMHINSSRIFEEKKRALEKGDDAVMHQVAEGRDIMSIMCKRRGGHTAGLRYFPVQILTCLHPQ